MCELIAVLGVASAVVGGVGAVQQANAAAAAATYQSRISEMNRQVNEQRAADALDRGKSEEQSKRLEVARAKSLQLVNMSANGVDVTTGSPLDTLVDTATLGELDALTIRTNAAREAYDYKVAAANNAAEAEALRMQAKASKTGGYLAAAGTVLGGLSKTLSTSPRFKSAFTFA